jgi:23S rRNA pseudouridine2605 synthase
MPRRPERRAPGAKPASRLRIQKVLAAQGVGSRREIEAWIAAGRITVNGKPAAPGQPIGPKEEIKLDGRRLRLDWREDPTVVGRIYHRPAQEQIRERGEDATRSSLERLPKPPGGRWIALSALGFGEGGLEVFVNDGVLAAAIMKQADKLSSEFSIRVRGEFDETRIPDLLAAAAADDESRGKLELIECTGGEGANRWARAVAVGLRPRDLKRIFERCGLEANRVLRTRFGPVLMDRALARGRSRQLSAGELSALREAVGIKEPARRIPRSPRDEPGNKRRGPPTGSRTRVR